jgi:hypothetical protein
VPLPPDSLAALQSRFEADFPRLERVARFRLRRLDGEAKDEAIAETIALCWQAYVRLVERGKSLAEVERYAPKTAEFSAKRVLCGRLLTGLRSRDALSPASRQRHGYAVARLPASDREGVPPELLDALLDGADSPADQAALRVDYEEWLGTLRANQRQVIEALAAGRNTVEVGEDRGVTYGAVSNMRQALRRKWEERFGDAVRSSGT